MRRIAILASGTGSNAERLIQHVGACEGVEVVLVLSNRPNAAVLQKAEVLGVPTVVFTKEEMNNGYVLKQLREASIDLIVLAGFLLLVPETLVKAFPERIINIHPALLPKHGGKGMYGMHVHQAVKQAEEQETGITIHLVDAEYDRGRILFQASCVVLSSDSAEEIAAKVQQLEHQHFPQVVADYALSI